MKLWNKVFHSFQKKLVDRLVKEEVNEVRKYYKALLRQQYVRHKIKEEELLQEIDLERNKLRELQNKANETIKRSIEIEELFSYKLLALNRIKETLNHTIDAMEKFAVVKNELKDAIQHLYHADSKHEVQERLLKNNALIYMKKR